MTHEELNDLYELYTLGALGQGERAEIEEHLAQNCPRCKAGVRRALSLNAFFATLPESIHPPKRLRTRVLASVGAESTTSRFWIGAWALLVAGLAIVLAIVGMDSHRRAQELAEARDEIRHSSAELTQARGDIRRSSAELTRLQSALQLLNLPDTRQVVFGKAQLNPPRGRVFVNRERGVLLMASNLPPAPAGKTYELWLLPKGAAPIPAGLFQSDAMGNALYIMNGAIGAATSAVAVTLEPEAGSPAPTTTPVIVASLGA